MNHPSELLREVLNSPRTDVVEKSVLELEYQAEDKAKEVAVARLFTALKNRKSDATWFVYLLQCADHSFYTGITHDLLRRLEQHNAGTASRYTRSRLPVVLVYHEPQDSQSHALKKELAIKALSRSQKVSLIELKTTGVQFPESSDKP